MLKTLPTEPDVFDSLEIDLSMNMVGTKGLLPVLEVIRISPRLRKFSVKENYLDNAACNQLVQALKDHPSISHLDVSHNPISWTGGMSLLELVDLNPRIKRVDVEGTHIKPDIIDVLARRIEQNQKGHKGGKKPKPINSNVCVRLRCLKALFSEIHRKENHAGRKIHKKNIIKGWKENKRLQGQEDQLGQSDTFWAELQLCCHPDSNDLITWEAFLLISMCEDVSYNPQDVENLREEFKRWDPDGNGYIDLLEMRQMMKELSGGREPSDNEVRSFLKRYDAEGNNTTNWDDFLLMMYEWQQGAPMVGSFCRVADTTLTPTKKYHL
jgi:hypothetical protein